MNNWDKFFGNQKVTEIKSDREILKGALEQCENVDQMFDVLKARYSLEECKPGPVVKGTLINGLLTAFDMLKPKLK